MSYAERLKHPKWQRRRLEIMSLADFKCQKCAADDKPLHVHHKLYRDGAEPWDYADTELICLCETCHDFEHVPVHSAAEMAVMESRLAVVRECLSDMKKAFDDLNALYDECAAERWELRKRVDLLELSNLPADARAAIESRKTQMVTAIKGGR